MVMTMPHVPEPVAVDPYFGGFVLETLTIGMYGETRNAIREYMQNAFDSVQRAIEMGILQPGEGLIALELAEDRNSLRIRDNGAGLSVRTAAETLVRIGASAKSHKKNAGFRGIGRLAGIVFSDQVTFTTKAKGETAETVVVIHASRMRDAMAPGVGSTKSAEDLLRECVTATRRPSPDVSRHSFEVLLEGFVDPPNECQSPVALADFISQVAPVPYHAKFPFTAELLRKAQKHSIPIEQVRTTIQDGDCDPVDVYKHYRAAHACAGKSPATLVDVEFQAGAQGKWWGWAGKKEESGAYTDSRVAGIRVRVRNIQIDGIELFRSMFKARGPSSDRFQEWYVGELFVDPGAVVPNARRDGFEEDEDWKRLKRELEKWAKKLGDDAYALSTKGQYSVPAQKRSLEKAKKEYRILQKAQFGDRDRTLTFLSSITKVQRRIAKGSMSADLESLASFQAINAELTDLKTEALSQAGLGKDVVDIEAVQQDSRDALLKEVVVLLEDGLPPNCFSKAKELLVTLSSTGEL